MMDMDDSQKNEFSRLLQAFHEAQERGDFKQTEAIGLQCLAFASEEAARNPSESLRLIEEADEHENAARWEQAEAAHRRALALAEMEADAAMIFKAHENLGHLHALLGNADNALREAQAAVEAARNTGMSPILARALRSVFRCHLMKGDIASADAAAGEAVQITSVEKMFETQHALALLMRARCRLEQHQVDQAGEDLNVSWRILAPQAEARMFSGIQIGLATWWEITARIRTHSKEYAEAGQAMSKAVEFRRIVSQLPHIDGPHKHYALAKVLQQYSSALMAAGETDAATKALGESQIIQMQIGISMPPSRME
jgi:tetratricopeptide (TPR) repeat protein